MMLRHNTTWIVLVGSLLWSSADPATGDDLLRPLLDQIWSFELDQDPLLASDVDDPRGADQLPDLSPDAISKAIEQRREFREQLRQIETTPRNDFQQVDFRVAVLRLENQIRSHEFGMHFIPIDNRSGFHTELVNLPKLAPPRDRRELDAYIKRLHQCGRYADQQIQWMRMGIDRGWTQPSIVMRDAASQVRAAIDGETDDLAWIADVPSATRQQFPDAVGLLRSAVDEVVKPAYERLAEFLQHEYVPQCRDSIAAAALPNGREFYRNRIAYHTTTDLTAEQLHHTGKSENERIAVRMREVMDKIGYTGEMPDFIKSLREDPKFYPTDADELMRRTALVCKHIDGQLPLLFGRLPRIPYGVDQIPAYLAPQTTTAYYWPPSADGSRAGVYYVNTYNLNSRPIYDIESLTAHEAVPGHHLQLALQAEITDLHPMTRQSQFTAFVEGWALYAEQLGYEIGLYQDAYSEFGQLNMEAWRASRLVVDTGIHAMGWSRQQAIEYMLQHTALSQHNIVAEVDRYIGWPGQALAYKTGELVIKSLRQEAEDKLGDRFDRRSFHDQVLAVGAIPMPMLQTRIRSWIDSELNGDDAFKQGRPPSVIRNE